MAARLKMLRVHSCTNQIEFALLIDRSQTQVSRWELGAHEPTLTSLRGYARLFGMSVSELLNGVM
jgi:transcriptional regulator with XRE-family HTH domain